MLFRSRGQSAAGLAQLRTAEQGCPKDFVEYAGAVVELKRAAQPRGPGAQPKR